MKPIRLPEPPSPSRGVPEIFSGGAYTVIRRAVVIGNGFPGSENQTLGLVHALGLSDKHVLYVRDVLPSENGIILLQMENFEKPDSELNLLTYYFLHGSSLSTDEAREARVTRPRGGINELLHWLPVSLHKKLDYVMRQIFGYSRLLLTSRREKLVPLPLENGSAGVSSVLEANVKQIVTMARDSYEKYALF
ncbi:hypothetical protein Pint_31818 [Pistacia integerrima]|uniref:Uncharacterized protein n=1 Tax=Pistacia integerrima TaxID=434235 RepID=A0ACC0XPK0_9ROSI|nr:hypothetical protein Pint_31818 [Pistacia integerrima]